MITNVFKHTGIPMTIAGLMQNFGGRGPYRKTDGQPDTHNK